MNELEKQLSTILEKAIHLAEESGKFVIDQAPLLLQEFYRWHIIKNAFTAIASIIVITIIWKGFKKLGKAELPNSSYNNYTNYFGKFYEELSGALMMIFGIICGGGIAFGSLLNSLYNILFILSSPKLYLIEYFIK